MLGLLKDLYSFPTETHVNDWMYALVLTDRKLTQKVTSWVGSGGGWGGGSRAGNGDSCT